MTDNDNDLIPLTHLLRILRERSGEDIPRGVNYRACVMLVYNDRLPTTVINGRNYVRPTDLPAIAKLLRVKLP